MVQLAAGSTGKPNRHLHHLGEDAPPPEAQQKLRAALLQPFAEFGPPGEQYLPRAHLY